MVFVKRQAGMLLHGQNDRGFFMRCFLEVERRGLLLKEAKLEAVTWASTSFISICMTYKVL
jgi:hypothetical protein